MIKENDYVIVSHFDWVKIEEFRIGEKVPSCTSIGVIMGFPKYRLIEGSGFGTSFKVTIKQDDRNRDSETYEIPQFRIRKNAYMQLWARLPRVATLSDGMNEIHIHRATAPKLPQV